MSIPYEQITELLKNTSQSRITNLIAQSDARRILQEVKESPDNYPGFDKKLTEKATYIAYTLIACGCSLIENNSTNRNDGYLILEKAGKILSDTYSYNLAEHKDSEVNLLIASMSLYASKQFSRAYICLSGHTIESTVGQIIEYFIRKDFDKVSELSTSIFYSNVSELDNIREYDDWIISHEIAHCFLLTLNFMYTGFHKNFDRIDNILSSLGKLSLEAILVTEWIIVRLLKIILSTFHQSSPWSILPSLFTSTQISERYIRLLRSFNKPITELWPSQIAALPLAVTSNAGAVINLRTSGGKTRVAEISILNTLAQNPDSKILYLAPFRSLALEIEGTLEKTFAPLGISVSNLYGGATVNVTDLDLIMNSQIIIATPEKAKALIRAGTGVETALKLIVIDEGHLLGGEYRYVRNEAFYTHLKDFAQNHEIRILLLSAVLPNAQELAKWICNDETNVAKSDWKPSLERLGFLLWDGSVVDLEWKSEGSPFNPKFVQQTPLGYGRRKKPFPCNKNEAIAATAVRLSENGCVMIYSARANSIEGLAKDVLLALGPSVSDFAWSHTLWNIFESSCQEELPPDDIILKAARKGVICHSNRLSPLVRMSIEQLMRSIEPRIIIASSTLGQGVNVGISTIIVSTPFYSDEPISIRDFWNICGRAGRAFSDSEGKILYAIDMTNSSWKIRRDKHLANQYFNSQLMEKTTSGILLLLKYIIEIAEESKISSDSLIEMVANNFSSEYTDGKITPENIGEINEVLDLIDDELLAMHEEFSESEDSAEWVDKHLSNSLAIIQAEEKYKSVYLNLLEARTAALLEITHNSAIRHRIISSGIPFSISKAMLEDIEFFKEIAVSYLTKIDSNNSIDEMICLVKQLDSWSILHAHALMDNPPNENDLDLVRAQWIRGGPVAQIIQSTKNASKIIKDYYGFTLPWIIHAISQTTNNPFNNIISDFYTSLASVVELGLPNQTAVNIFLSGIHSRAVAIELSQLESFFGKSTNEINTMLSDSSFDSSNLSPNAQLWIKVKFESLNMSPVIELSFPKFRLTKEHPHEDLYIRSFGKNVLLTTLDDYYFSVESTTELPFMKIAKYKGLYFKWEDSVYTLCSYNPFIKVTN